MDKFKLVSKFKPQGDQPQAIKKLVAGLKRGLKHQVLLGVTGSGKTYTIAQVIAQIQRPVLIVSHNKTLASQTYQELKEFFPHNPVSFFISYYDYYQPEAYLPASDTYISKEVNINPLIERLRLETTRNIFNYPRSIVVASVSCLYNLGAPELWQKSNLELKVGKKQKLTEIISKLIDLYYQQQTADFLPATFRRRANRLDIFLASSDNQIVRVYFSQGKISQIETTDFSGRQRKNYSSFLVYPAKHY